MVQHAGFEGFQIERGMLDRLQTALTSAAAAESDKQQCASAIAQMALEKNPLHCCTFNDALYGEDSCKCITDGAGQHILASNLKTCRHFEYYPAIRALRLVPGPDCVRAELMFCWCWD
jgi:hypothetical protein